MKRILTLTALAAIAVAPVFGQATLYDLRTEFLSNPIGIDAAKPRFSWKMKDNQPGAGQKAYQVQVASSADSLKAGKADIWDSGRQETSASQGIVYAGPDLKPRTPYVWRVKAWDLNDKETAYTDPASWETGLLSQDNWKAKWISGEYGSEATKLDVDKVRWIWYPEGDPVKKAPKGSRYFKTEFELPAKKIASAQAWSLSDNESTIYINGQRSLVIFNFKTIVPVDVQSHLKAGKNEVQARVINSSAGPAGLAFAIDITYEDGTKTQIHSDGSWKVARESGDDWPADTRTTGTAKWVAAKDVGEMGIEPWGKPNMETVGPPASQFRKPFEAAEKPTRARLYITALGSYRAQINGKRVGHDILTPDWTDYRKRVNYQAYDVTDLVQQGKNAVGVILGDGWYGSGLGWGLERLNFGPAPTRLLAELHIDYADGKHDVVVTDASWKTALSPIERSEIYYGEIYDARKEQPGWSTADFDDSKWEAAKITPTDAGIKIVDQASAPIRVRQEITPIGITEPSAGTYVYDMGQNMVGWVKLKVKGKAGDKVRLRFAEILKDDGNIYRDNLRRAEATDTYILKGDGEETFVPHFTYHGFRYVEVTGYPGGKPGKEAITGEVFHTDLKQTGKFESSDEMVNKIVHNTQWGLWGNLMSVPTDCPQRDERLGWTGDAEAIWKTACYLMDMEAFTEKWCADLRDAQGDQGDYPNVAPRVISTNPGAPAWGDAGVILPYQAWRMYGDTRLLEEMWDSMEAWLGYIQAENPNYLWLNRRGNDYGDWVPANSTTDKALVATAYWAGDARMMSEMAAALGKADKVKKYDELYANIKKAFQEKFIQPDGKIANGSQTCYVLALENDLVQPDMIGKAVGHLLDDIKARGNHLSTGFLGSTHLMPVLTNSGNNAMAITLLLNKTFPSWGYMIAKGATTIWERWNGDTGDPSMNSFNHYNYGAVVDWMYGYLAGVRPATPGFNEIIVAPHPDERINWVKVSYDSILGPIVSEWKNVDDGLEMKVVIPANSSAIISAPTGDVAKVQRDGKALSADLKAEVKDGRVEFAAAPGTYNLKVLK